MSTPAQITIAGALEKEHIATLVEVAIAAGAALVVQPRAIVASNGDVVLEAAPPRKALPPPVRRTPAKAGRPRTVPAADVAVMDRVRRVLKDGPLSPAEFCRVAKLGVHAARKLVESGAIVATGVTHGRRYALPGSSAKEAP